MSQLHAIGTVEDGFRPPADPDDWNAVYCVTTGEACPRCETALCVLLGPAESVDGVAGKIQAEHGFELPDGWHEGYDYPVYLFCDRPACSYHGVAEWAKVNSVLEEWIHRDAPTWRQRSAGATNA